MRPFRGFAAPPLSLTRSGVFLLVDELKNYLPMRISIYYFLRDRTTSNIIKTINNPDKIMILVGIISPFLKK